jgi:DNA excision repair protein ERCC-2
MEHKEKMDMERIKELEEEAQRPQPVAGQEQNFEYDDDELDQDMMEMDGF